MVFICWGMKSSRHGPYRLGYTRVTMVVQNSGKEVIRSKSANATLVQIAGCNSPCMKAESLVIVDQHATVNVLGLCTHRPSRQGSDVALKYSSFC